MYDRKRSEIRRNCLLQAISPFLTMFSTAIYLKCVKMQDKETVKLQCQNVALCCNGLTAK